MTPTEAQDLAERVAREAGAFCLSRFGQVTAAEIGHKGPRDFVSEVDRRAEQIARDLLAVATPDIPVLGEEGGGTLAETCWVVDPLDGTSPYLSGLPLWCVSVALYACGRPVAGAIVAPALALEISGGGPGTLRTHGYPTLPPGDMARTIAVGRNPLWPRAERLHREAALESAGHTVFNLGSCALSLAFVALNRLGGYVEHGTRIWDCAAGVAICTAAGVPAQLGPTTPDHAVDLAAGSAVTGNEMVWGLGGDAT